uniref:Uncharacterized protein n=1 Tax=Vibrio cholerae serotype O1 biovar El Tor TaxID=686 RepID=M1RHE0_VIBCE|nr:hypothetical protein [Vibrio cholerae O1 biovar El Tor]
MPYVSLKPLRIAYRSLQRVVGAFITSYKVLLDRFREYTVTYHLPNLLYLHLYVSITDVSITPNAIMRLPTHICVSHNNATERHLTHFTHHPNTLVYLCIQNSTQSVTERFNVIIYR